MFLITINDVAHVDIDTTTPDTSVLEVDFHYQIDSDGSNEEYVKW